MKIVALSAPFPGVTRVLEESEKLGLLELVKLDPDRIKIPPADVYILGAWHSSYAQIVRVLEGSRIGILWTSSIGEMQFEPIEQDYLAAIIANPAIEFVWFGDESLGEMWEKGFYAPYPMKLPEDSTFKLQVKQDIVTLFCPNTVKKNQLNPLFAVALLQRKHDLVLHTNIPIDLAFAKSINLKYVQYGWLPQEQYQSLIASSKLNFAVSWAETLNYGSAEAALWGTCSITSSTIPWFKPFKELDVPQNSAISIASLADEMLSNREQWEEKAFDQAINHFERANKLLEQALSRLVT